MLLIDQIVNSWNSEPGDKRKNLSWSLNKLNSQIRVWQTISCRFGPLFLFINKVLSEHSCSIPCLFTYCLWFLYSSRVEQSQQGLYDPQSLKYLLLSLQKNFASKKGEEKVISVRKPFILEIVGRAVWNKRYRCKIFQRSQLARLTDMLWKAEKGSVFMRHRNQMIKTLMVPVKENQERCCILW